VLLPLPMMHKSEASICKIRTDSKLVDLNSVMILA
jgi:hypothetical protein